MSYLQADILERAARATMAWSPEGYDGRVHVGAVMTAVLPAIGILAAAAAFLFIAF